MPNHLSDLWESIWEPPSKPSSGINVITGADGSYETAELQRLNSFDLASHI